MKPRSRCLYFIIIGALLLWGLSLRAEEGEEKEAAPPEDLYQSLELFSRVVEIVRKNYVKEIKAEDIIYGALHGMLSSLDPYSQFMEPEIYNEMKVDTKGEFGGLGIEISVRDGILTVVSPIEDTPASRAGLQPGDKIVKIDDESTKDITLMQAVKRLRGQPGTEVRLTIMRPGEKEFLEFTLTRDIIEIESVKEARLLQGGIGYIRLAQFQQNTVDEFDEALKKLQAEDLKALIIDLRYNPGGLLSTAVEIADRFLSQGEIIVQTLGRGGRVEMEVKATGRKVPPDLPLVVLINEGSASGSEIVAGALRDNHRAILVGTKTFGKGSVQSVLPLPDESAIRLTTGHYYTASKRSIQDEGIEPDIEIKMSDEEKKAFFLKRYKALEKVGMGLEEEALEEEEVEEPKAEEKEERKDDEEQKEEEELDPQLQKAFDLLKGILIFREFQEELGIES